jgi:hypothetical protein
MRMRRIGRHITYANVTASLALFIALGGGAYAVAGNPFVGRKGKVSVCVQEGDRTLRAVKPGAKCAAGEVALTLNQRGKRGKRGLPGAIGATGAAGAAGARGLQGPAGAAGTPGADGTDGIDGAGFEFTTVSGVPGPTLAAEGTYFVNVQLNAEGSTAHGTCNVTWSKSEPGGGVIGGTTWVRAAIGTSGGRFSFSGMLSGLPAGVELGVLCLDGLGPVAVEDVGWWISPISA